MAPKKLINHPDDLIDELIAGIVSAHPRHVHLSGETGRAIVANTGPRPGKVGIVIGGGSGHEPAFACYVGQGLADAAPVGNIFASPSPAHIVDAALAADTGSGVLFLYGNYAGDVMNFDMAAEQLGARGIRAESFLVTDDIASAPPERAFDRRGIAGDFFVFKIAGAAADMGLPFDEVKAAAALANARTRTMGVALSACSMPQTGTANFHIPEGEMEVGMGIHGEPGVERAPIETADQVADRLLGPILDELACESGDRVAVLVNGLGATTLLEQYIIHRRIAQTLEARGVQVHHSWVGEYCTSLEMAGVSVTLMKLDDALTAWLDHPCDTPALTVGTPAPPGRSAAPPVAAIAPVTPETRAAPAAAPVAAPAPASDIRPEDLARDGDLSPELFRAALRRVVTEIGLQKDHLCALDGAIGDGDHGVTMDIGWRAIAGRLDAAEAEAQTVSRLSEICGEAFLASVGASAGPLYASGFQAAARAVSDRWTLTPQATARWIAGMAEGIAGRGRAQPGDKTMMDAWHPASEAAIAQAEVAGATSATVMAAAAKAAWQGADATRDLVSAKGRSRTLGPRSVGHVDPGAVSAAMILTALSGVLLAEDEEDQG